MLDCLGNEMWPFLVGPMAPGDFLDTFLPCCPRQSCSSSPLKRFATFQSDVRQVFIKKGLFEIAETNWYTMFVSSCLHCSHVHWSNHALQANIMS
jgi:hypothetical protein